MDDLRPLLLDAWKEASRPSGIGDFTARINRVIGGRLPLGTLLVARFDAARGFIETVSACSSDGATVEPRRRELSGADTRRLLAWLRAGKVATWRGDRAGDRTLAAIVPEEITRDALVGPLLGEHAGRRGADHQVHGAMGVLIIEARGHARLTADHRRMAEALLEPFTAALENDHRLHELDALREAAEAERQALLRRLGREQHVDEVIGADGGLKPVMERVELVARAGAPVLIIGETGSGKEVVARAIHARSARAAGPFIRVNGGAIPPELIDSELFGHEKGAFTGAAATRRGWFERADEGTLFLDEIGELPPAAQVRLLRIVQEGAFERVGGEQTLKVDVRIVAATHRDLPAMVQQGRFREDLWYRVAIFPIVLPPLREHKQDIPRLAEHFARRAARRFGVPEVEPSAGDVELLQRYDWPGNVRELASVIDRAVILGNGERLEIGKAIGGPFAADSRNVEAGVLQAGPAAHRPGAAPHEAATAPASLAIDAAMKRHIESVLALTRGRIEGAGGAAARLEINPHTLRARMRKLGVDWSKFRA